MHSPDDHMWIRNILVMNNQGQKQTQSNNNTAWELSSPPLLLPQGEP